MSERQRQYEQLRVTEATNRIYKYRMKKLMPEGENAMVAKDKRAARTRKIRYMSLHVMMYICFQTDGQNKVKLFQAEELHWLPSRSSLIWVNTDCYSVCIFWRLFSTLRLIC